MGKWEVQRDEITCPRSQSIESREPTQDIPGLSETQKTKGKFCYVYFTTTKKTRIKAKQSLAKQWLIEFLEK
jgi:hypothetical protein